MDTEANTVEQSNIEKPVESKTEKAVSEVNPETEEIMEVDSTEIDEERKSLWISNLSSSTKAADLKALFQSFGKVMQAKIFTTRSTENPTCFGYVILDSAGAAWECKKKYDRSNFKGKVVSIETVARTPISGASKPTNTQSTEPTNAFQSTEQPNPAEQPKHVEQPKAVVVEPVKKVETPMAGIKEEIDDDIQIINPPASNAPSTKIQTAKVSPVKTSTSKDQQSKISTSKEQQSKTFTSKDQQSKTSSSKDQQSKTSSNKDQPARSSSNKDQPAKSSSSGKKEEKAQIKAPGSSSNSSHRDRSKTRIDKQSSSRTGNRQPIPSRRSSDFIRPKDAFKKRELNREIKNVTARFSDGSRSNRRNAHPAPFSRPINAVNPQAQPIFSQNDVIRMVQDADAMRKSREDAIEKERARMALELEKARVEKQKLKIEQEKQKLQLERMEFQLKQAQQDKKALEAQQKYASSKDHSSYSKDSAKQRFSPPTRDPYRNNISESSSRHRANRSRSPIRSRVDRIDRKPEPVRYQESSSSRDRSTRHDEYYDSRSSARPQKEQLTGYGTSSYVNPTIPSVQPQSRRYEMPIKDNSTVYEKRLAALSDTYGNGDMDRLTSSYNRDVYSDRKKDTYGGLPNLVDPYGGGVSGIGNVASLSYDPVDLRYAANPTSYSRTMVPESDTSRYEKLYSSGYSASIQAAQMQQQPSWGTSTVYDNVSGWPRQSTEYTTGTNSYTPNVQYDYIERRF